MNDYLPKYHGVNSWDDAQRELEEFGIHPGKMYRNKRSPTPRNGWQGIQFGCVYSVFYSFFPWFLKYVREWRYKWIP